MGGKLGQEGREFGTFGCHWPLEHWELILEHPPLCWMAYHSYLKGDPWPRLTTLFPFIGWYVKWIYICSFVFPLIFILMDGGVYAYGWIMMMMRPSTKGLPRRDLVCVEGDGLLVFEARQAIQWLDGMEYLWYGTPRFIWINGIDWILWTDYLWWNGYTDGSNIIAWMMVIVWMDWPFCLEL